jgi:hypothetical protein
LSSLWAGRMMRATAGPRGSIRMRRTTGSVQGWHPPAHPRLGKPMILIEGGHVMPRMTGAKFTVQMIQAYRVPHAFYDTEA